MTIRVTLLSPAQSTAAAKSVFEDGHSLTAAGHEQARRAAAALDGVLGGAREATGSGTVRCEQTAAALGLRLRPGAELAGWGVGSWRGGALDELAGSDPAAVRAWLTDPQFTPPGGESLGRLCARVGDWLTRLGTDAGGNGSGAGDGSGDRSAGSRVAAVVEPDVVRAALVAALDAPLSLFWRLDVRPLTATVLSGRAGRWNVAVGSPLAPQTSGGQGGPAATLGA